MLWFVSAAAGAAPVAVKEVREETATDCEVELLVMVLAGLLLGFSRLPLYSLVFRSRCRESSMDRRRTYPTDRTDDEHGR